MAEKTLSDFAAKDNKKLPFEERSKQFAERIRPICEELGVIPWAQLLINTDTLMAAPLLKDLWDSGKE